MPPCYAKDITQDVKDRSVVAYAHPRVKVQKRANLELIQFRFHKYHTQRFERLVLQFKSRDKKIGYLPMTTSLSQGKEVQIQIKNVNLIGEIPEDSINESYVSKSRFLGPLSIDLDQTDSLVVKLFLQEPSIKIKASLDSLV